VGGAVNTLYNLETSEHTKRVFMVSFINEKRLLRGTCKNGWSGKRLKK